MKPGKYPVSLIVQSNGDPIRTTATLSFTPSLHLPHSEMVPKPHPIETSLDVCAYYFPGWNTRRNGIVSGDLSDPEADARILR
ncbi:MAG: hypothetical protein H6751_14770 [Candidatus Omnitrophica bacterium]|nr:hypothetical protein [Candidatus Omnitrophota bacterium]